MYTGLSVDRHTSKVVNVNYKLKLCLNIKEGDVCTVLEWDPHQ